MAPRSNPSGRAIALALVATMLLALAGPTVPGAGARSVKEDLEKARREHAAAKRAVDEAERRVDDLLGQLQAVPRDLARVAADLVQAYQSQRDLADELARAQAELDRRATEAYIFGIDPMSALDVYLGARTMADLSSVSIFVQSAFEPGGEVLDRVTTAKQSLADLAGSLQARQRDLAALMESLPDLVAQAQAELDDALARARAANVKVHRLAEKQRELEAAAAAARQALATLISPSRGVDQSRLLALLGPTGGKTCAIPAGLIDTGQRLAGMSSWYGWDFAGQHTASGAIFDPQLFTVANKELPLGVFLRFHYNGVCAITLLNDRGPYGVEGRIFDVSEAVATYLGYKSAGVAYVTADVLVPSS